MRSKAVRSPRVPPPKNAQSPLVILGSKKKASTGGRGGANAAAPALKTKAQPKLGRGRAAPAAEPPKAKLKKAEKSGAEVAKPKAAKVATAPRKQQPPKPKKEKAAPPAKKLAPPTPRKVKPPKGSAPVGRPKKQPEKKTEPPPPLLLKDGVVRKRAPYKKRVKAEPASIELTDSAIAKILSKTKEPRGTKDKKPTQQDAAPAEKPAKKPPKPKAVKPEKPPAKIKEEKKPKTPAVVAKTTPAAPAKEVKKEPVENKVKPEPVVKDAAKKPQSKAMNPPKKRAMAPLKKRLVARAAIDEAALHAQLALAAEKQAKESKPATKKTGPKAPPVVKAAKEVPKKTSKKADVASSSSSPSSPDPPKTKKQKAKTAPPPARSEKMLPPKKRNLQAMQLCKPPPKASAKKQDRRDSTSDSEDDSDAKSELDVFRFWAEPKKHRVASLNALAKVHCMYENESSSRPMIEGPQAAAASSTTTTTTTTTRSISTRTKSSQWYDSSSESSTSGSESSPGTVVPYRRPAGRPPKKVPPKKPAKPKKPKEEEEEEDDDDETEESAPSPPPKVRRKKKKCDMLMDLKDMVVRKRMASLNASAILAASYSFEKRSPKGTTTVEVVEVKQQTSTSIDKKAAADTVSTSSINMVRVRKNKILEGKKVPGKRGRPTNESKRKKLEESTTDDASADEPDLDDVPLSNVIKLRNPKKVALIMNDTDVTITGVYVNSRTTEGYCISGMEYRIQSTQTKSTTVVQPTAQAATVSPAANDYVAQHHHLHHHHHHHTPSTGPEQGVYQQPVHADREAPGVFLKPAPPQNYTPLGALSSMQPPAPLQQQPGAPPPVPPPLHHQPPLGSSGSAFSAPISTCSAPAHDQPHYLQGYYQPAGPLIHAGAELCCAPPKVANHSAPVAAPSASNAVSPLLIAATSTSTSAASTSTESTSTTRIVSSQASPFAAYQPAPQYPPAPPPPTHYIAQYAAPPQYSNPQFYHPQANHQLVAASHHLAPPPPHEICTYTPCYAPPHYKYSPAPSVPYHHRYAPPTQHYFPYSAPPPPPSSAASNPHPQSMPSTSASKLSAPSTSATPTTVYHPPPPPVIAQHPPEPPHYHFYAGYSPGGPAGPCFPHPAASRVAYLDSSYQSACPCPMQSCPKNVHTGPLTGDSKGPGPQESLFVLPTAALPGEAGGPLAPGHPSSPARGSSGGPAAAQGPTPPPVAAEEEHITPPAWVAAEPTPPPSDDSSAAPRASFFYLDGSATDVNQNYNRKRRLTSGSSGGGAKRPKSEQPPQQLDHEMNNNAPVPANLSEPLLITTTMLADAGSGLKLHPKALPLTPPTSSDTSPSISSTGSKPGSEEKLKKVQRKLSALGAEKVQPQQTKLFSGDLQATPKTSKKPKCPEPSAAAPEVVVHQQSSPAVVSAQVVPEEPAKNAKARKKSGQTATPAPKKSKKAAAADRLAEEAALSDLAKNSLLRKSFVPKWSNGWSWEGEPYQAKVFLRSDDPPALRTCYPAMRHEEGDVIMPRDCILLKSGTRKGDLPYVAKVTALWENPEDGEMMLSLLWYYRPEHTEQGRQPNHMADEIFASKHKDNSSVACIEDKCYVLTFNEYCRYRAKAKQIEVGALARTSIVPEQASEETWSERRQRQPACLAAPELVFFCRRVYDFRCKRMLKNPGA